MIFRKNSLSLSKEKQKKQKNMVVNSYITFVICRREVPPGGASTVATPLPY